MNTSINFSKRRWLILAASCLVNLCVGSLYAWSVFATPMAEHLTAITGKEVSSLAIVFTVANAVGPITMISGGFVNDRLGPKSVIFAGGLLFGAGMILSGFAASVGMLMVAYCVGVGLGVGLVYGCTISNSVKMFPDKRGFAGGVATASYGISSIIVPPVANMLVGSMGITASFKVLGLVMMVIVCGSALFIEACPAGFIPEGYRNSTAVSTRPERNWKQMLQDPIFYVMIIIMCCGAFSGLMVISQASPLAQRMVDMTVAQAATAVSVLALFNTLGRIAAGFMSDKLGVLNTMRAVFAVSAICLMLLRLCTPESLILFYVGLCVVGLSFGSIMGVYPGFTAAQFGSKNNSVNYGIMMIGFASAGYFGPTIMTTLYKSSGSDKAAFAVAAALSVLGFAMSFIYAAMEKGRKSIA